MMFANLKTKLLMTLFLTTALFYLDPYQYERTSFERSCYRASAPRLAD
jgi:hypothetical protein